MSSYKIIVAKYNEDVEWLNYLKKENIILYNKGTTSIPDNIKTIIRPNIGREAETYFHYIIENYEELPDYIFLLQGNPFDHFINNIIKVNKYNLQKLIDMIIFNKPDTITPLFTNRWIESINTYPTLLCNDYYNFLLNYKKEDNYLFAAGCQYIIPKENILLNPIEFYKRIYLMLLNEDIDKKMINYYHKKINMSEAMNYNNDILIPFGINGWTLERILLDIFLPNKKINSYMTCKIYLVTGAAGFIGSNMVDMLLENGNTVIAIDNLTSGNMNNLNNAINNYPNNFYFIKDDILNKNIYKYIGFIDGIFHMADLNNMLPNLNNIDMIEIYNEQNIKGTIEILNFASSFKNKVKVIYSASSFYYGLNKIPHTETLLHDCQTNYALSKYCGELYCELFTKLYNVPTIRLRYFMVYGEREPIKGLYATVISIFLNNYKNNKSLEIYGDGSQKLDFVYVKDVCESCIIAMNNNTLYNETINIGTGNMISIQEIANIISDNQIYINEYQLDLKESLCDTNKMKTLLKWHPKHNVKDYLMTKLNN